MEKEDVGSWSPPDRRANRREGREFLHDRKLTLVTFRRDLQV